MMSALAFNELNQQSGKKNSWTQLSSLKRISLLEFGE